MARLEPADSKAVAAVFLEVLQARGFQVQPEWAKRFGVSKKQGTVLIDEQPVILGDVLERAGLQGREPAERVESLSVVRQVIHVCPAKSGLPSRCKSGRGKSRVAPVGTTHRMEQSMR